MSIENNVQTNDTPRRDDELGTPPQSRIESDLMNQPVKPQSRIEKLLTDGFVPIGTKFAVNLHGEMNSTTYVLTMYLVDQEGTKIGDTVTIDFPLEAMVVGAEYDSTNQALVIILNNGTRTSVPIGALVGGLLPDYGTYTQFSSGKRLYISSTEPTGDDIPDGSVWIGGAVSS